MKSKSLIITLIVVLSCFVVALTGGLIFLLFRIDNFDFSFNFNDSSMELVDSIETNEVNKIYLNLNSTDIFIKKSENDKVVVEYYSNREKNPIISYSDNIISIDEDKYKDEYDSKCFVFCNINRKIVLYVPFDFETEFDINTKSGDIKSEVDLSNNVVSVSTMSGDVFLGNASNIDIRTVSGDVSLDSIVSSDVSTTSGDISIKNVSKMINIQTTSGDVLIDNLDIENESSIKTVSGDVVINHNKGNCYVDFKTTSGDERISRSDRKSDIVLKVRTTSGDISVD